MDYILQRLGFHYFIQVLFLPLSWLPAACVSALEIVFSILAIILIGRLLKFIWDALPIA